MNVFRKKTSEHKYVALHKLMIFEQMNESVRERGAKEKERGLCVCVKILKKKLRVCVL